MWLLISPPHIEFPVAGTGVAGTEDGYIQPGDMLDVDILIQNVGNVNTLGNISG